MMDIDLVKLLYEKIINCDTKDRSKNIDTVSKNILFFHKYVEDFQPCYHPVLVYDGRFVSLHLIN